MWKVSNQKNSDYGLERTLYLAKFLYSEQQIETVPGLPVPGV